MSNKRLYDIAIIGGGIAGSSAAIRLARSGWSVIVLEQKRYPVQKLCGEFLSPESLGYLKELNVLHKIEQLGASKINTVRLISSTGTEHSTLLNGEAIGISRYELDRILRDQAIFEGADFVEGEHVIGVTGTIGQFVVQSESSHYSSKFVIGAYGKNSRFQNISTCPVHCKSDYFAVKQHYEDDQSSKSIDMYGYSGGYVGISPIEKKLRNACFIVRSDQFRRVDGKLNEFFDRCRRQNRKLDQRLDSMQAVGKPTATSHIPFNVKKTWEGDMMMIGDTAGMIAPLCGDGMSIAMRSAEIATSLVNDFLNSKVSDSILRQTYTIQWNREFRLRIHLGQILQSIAANEWVADSAVNVCNLIPTLAKLLIRATRGECQSKFANARS